MFRRTKMKLIPYIIITALITVSCESTEQAGIKVVGSVETPVEYGQITLQTYGESGLVSLDSVIVGEDGGFEFNIAAKSPDFYRISFFNRQFINLILTGEEETVTIQADGSNPNGKYIVEGSRDTKLMLMLDSIARKKRSDVDLLNQEAIQARSQGDIQTLQDITNQYYYLSAKHDQNMKNQIMSSIPSLAALYGINYVDIENEFQFADSLASKYMDIFPEHPFTQDLKTQVDQLRKLALGATAPEIALPSPSGEAVSLSSLRGNYVLIDFWAAWCRPCRAENPNVVRLYNKYKGENFEIFGVSLDRKRDAWLKAIEDDGLIWKHVSDLQYFNSVAAKAYNINAIPATYLIDPEGKIIAKGLRGESLRAKLEEIFG
jgi:peroxiredoxin